MHLWLVSTQTKMQDKTEKGLRKGTTHVARIAVALQDVPGKMLTFTQLMDKLAPLFCKDRKSSENNIRVCLSTHKCFVKVPLDPDSVGGKRNYWKLDSSQITPKMVRRHFRGLLQLFPELASKVETENMRRPSKRRSALRSPEAAQVRREVMFNSPFSIESLLKRNSPSAQTSRASPLSSAPVGAEQQPWSTEPPVGTTGSLSWDSEEPLLLQASAGSFPTCSTGGSNPYRLTVHGAAVPIKRMDVCAEPSFPIYTGASVAPYFSSAYSSFTPYSAPEFRHDAFRFWL